MILTLVLNTIVVYNEISKPIVKQKIKLENHHFKIGIFGYLSEQKNQKEALKAISLVNTGMKIKLYLVGGGCPDKYLELADSLGIKDKVTFIGYTDDVGAYYEEMDIVIVCAKNEALGRVTVETMLYNKCVIGKRSGATSEIIYDSKNGLLYNTINELASQIELLYKNSQIRTDLAKNANNLAVTKFSNGLSIKRIYSEILKLINEKPVSSL